MSSNATDNPQQSEAHVVQERASSANLSLLPAASSESASKIWVVKLKNITRIHREDPYIMQQEISKLRVQYLQNRYNQHVKLVSSD